MSGKFMRAAKHYITDEVHWVTVSGTPDEAKVKVAEYIKNRCTCPILYSVGGNYELLIDTFSPL